MEFIRAKLGRNTNATDSIDRKKDINLMRILGQTPRPGLGELQKLDSADVSRPEAPTTFSPLSQDKSSFFTILPPEIRHKIYGYVLGDEHVYHIVDASGPRRRLAHFHCPHGPFSTPCCSPNPCGPGTSDLNLCQRRSPFKGKIHSPSTTAWPYPIYFRPNSISNASLALLRTCRQAYSETRLLPYEKNCFRFSFLETFLAFSYCLRPTSLAAIRHLHIYWQIFWPLIKDRSPDPALGIQAYKHSVWFQGCEIYHFQTNETWLTFWETVSGKLPALEGLRLKLEFRDGEKYREQLLIRAFGDDKGMKMSLDADWLQPVLKVRGLKEFEMKITESIPPPSGREKCLAEVKRIVCQPSTP